MKLAKIPAFTFVIDHEEGASDDAKVSGFYATLCLTFPMILIGIILILFYLFHLQLDRFGPDELKIALGSVETFFGVFLGAISKLLFGAASDVR